MDLGSFFVILGIFLLTLLFLVRPFLEEKDQNGQDRGQRYSQLAAEKESLLSTIQELDHDLELQKISPDVHHQKRAQLAQKAARVLEKLDQLQGKSSPAAGTQSGTDPEDDELEALISSRRQELKEEVGGYCPHCGGEVKLSDQYCTHCGEKI